MSKDNKKDIDEIKPDFVAGLTFRFVENVEEVLSFALLDEKVKNPVDFRTTDEKEKAAIGV